MCRMKNFGNVGCRNNPFLWALVKWEDRPDLVILLHMILHPNPPPHFNSTVLIIWVNLPIIHLLVPILSH